MTTRTIGWDFVGRVQNISLAPSPANALLPVFEAITNSIQAIEDRFGSSELSKGTIRIEVIRDVEASVNGFIVTDNGIGLTPANMRSFETSDSRYKIAKGGKGVGRFVWLKVFEAVHIDSRYTGERGEGALSFDFVLAESDQLRNIAETNDLGATGTRVTLGPFRPQYRSVCPKKAETIQAKIISHFLAYFIGANAPNIVLVDGNASDLSRDFADYVKERRDYPLELEYGGDSLKFALSCLLLPKYLSDDEKGVNAIYYGANGRAVMRRPIDNAIGMKAIEGSYAFFGYVTGSYLDSQVNQERTAIAWDDDVGDDLHVTALATIKSFLGPQIEKIRTKQAGVVKRLLDENLRFLTIISDPSEFANSLDLGTQSTEDVFIELSRKARREENKTRAEYREAKRTKTDIDADVKKYTEKLNRESLASLAEYVYKRKLILDAFDDKLNYVDEDKMRYELEEIVHELIVPLRSTSDELDYQDHNLWIVDDQLAFYSYFNSDKTLKVITGGGDPSTKEPDITLFDLGLGMERAGSAEPVSIIEFKRPGRDNYTLSDNPIVQLREYCSRLRKAGRLVTGKGREIRAVDANTPFHGHIIADLTESLLDMMKQFGPYAQKAGHSCYYKWDDDFHMFIQIQSYSDVLKGARARNEAFFQKLGIS
jgi:hypothetical protein